MNPLWTTLLNKLISSSHYESFNLKCMLVRNIMSQCRNCGREETQIVLAKFDKFIFSLFFQIIAWALNLHYLPTELCDHWHMYWFACGLWMDMSLVRGNLKFGTENYHLIIIHSRRDKLTRYMFQTWEKDKKTWDPLMPEHIQLTSTLWVPKFNKSKVTISNGLWSFINIKF